MTRSKRGHESPTAPVAPRTLLAPALVCVGVGLLISLLPSFLLLLKGQRPLWLADSDELLYLAVGGQSYFDHPLRLADPILQGHAGRSMFPWIQFAPGILAARVLHAGPLAIGFFWRAFAGFSIGLGFFLVLWKIVRKPWLAAACATWMLSDAGVVTGQPLFQHLAAMRKLALVRGDYLIQGEPQILRLWRIITPGLSLAYLLVFLLALLQARASPTRRFTIFAGLAFGFLFYVYFYYWTAAAVALGICALLDKGLRRVSISAGLLGGLIGIPAVVSGFMLKNTSGHDWLQRTDNFVPIPHFSEQLWFIVPDCILMGLLIWVLARRRDLMPVWALAFSGMILANHQILTGLQIQNYHYVYVFGPMFSVLAMSAFASAAGWLEQRQPLLVKFGVGVLAVGSLLSGLWLRAAEAELTVVPLRLQEDLREYRSQREGATGALDHEPIARLAPDSVIAGDPMFLDLAAILEDQRPLTHYALLFSPAISNRDWDRRDALNAYLTGQTIEEFVVHQREFFAHLVYGPTVRDIASRDLRVASREKEFRDIQREPAGALREFKLRYVALTGNQKLPEAVASEFTLVQQGPTWTIWESPAWHSAN